MSCSGIDQHEEASGQPRAQRLHPATKHPLGSPEPVHHFHDARFSPIHNAAGSNEAAVARDKIVLPVTGQTAHLARAVARNQWPETKPE